eukprot:3347774-Amphidinium_carterae.1
MIHWTVSQASPAHMLAHQDYHRRFTVNSATPEVQSSKWFYDRAYEADQTETMFSGTTVSSKKMP